VTKYVLTPGDKVNIVISKNVHNLLLIYAKENNLTVQEATYRLFQKAFASELKKETED